MPDKLEAAQLVLPQQPCNVLLTVALQGELASLAQPMLDCAKGHTDRADTHCPAEGSSAEQSLLQRCVKVPQVSVWRSGWPTRGGNRGAPHRGLAVLEEVLQGAMGHGVAQVLPHGHQPQAQHRRALVHRLRKVAPC